MTSSFTTTPSAPSRSMLPDKRISAEGHDEHADPVRAVLGELLRFGVELDVAVRQIDHAHRRRVFDPDVGGERGRRRDAVVRAAVVLDQIVQGLADRLADLGLGARQDDLAEALHRLLRANEVRPHLFEAPLVFAHLRRDRAEQVLVERRTPCRRASRRTRGASWTSTRRMSPRSPPWPSRCEAGPSRRQAHRWARRGAGETWRHPPLRA